jgi:protein ImuA
MTARLLQRSYVPDPAQYPAACEPLEEVGAAQPGDAAAALAFGLARLARGPGTRPLAIVTLPTWLRERGRPFGRGLARWGVEAERLIWVRAETEAEALWALEEALKSGAVAGGLVTAEHPPFVTTRRLAFAARAGRAAGVILRTGEVGDLSAARRRWRIAARGSGLDPYDAAAPGTPRLRADLTRRRDGPPAGWDLELDDETHGLRVVAGLADHGLAAAGADDGRPDAERGTAARAA